jgi:hypothetical protein
MWLAGTMKGKKEYSMALQFKVKVGHVFNDGSKLEYEAYLEAETYDTAYQATVAKFQQAAKEVAVLYPLTIEKAKVEVHGEQH